MAGRIRQEDIEAVKERTDIVKLVSQYLELKKTGHDSLSRAVPVPPGEDRVVQRQSPSKQVFYCFGCGKGGDVDHVPRGDGEPVVRRGGRAAGQAGRRHAAVRGRLADRTPRGAAPRSCSGPTTRPPSCTTGCCSDGREAEDARAYLEERGHRRRERRELRDRLRARLPGLPAAAAGEALSARDCCSRPGSRPRARTAASATGSAGRLTFPIQDLQGRAVGFGARILPARRARGRAAKYLNTAETPVYRKGELLYNLHRAKADGRAIRAGVRGRGLHRRDRARAGRDRQRGRDVRDGAGRATTSGCCRGSRRARCWRSTPTRRARARPSGRSRSRSSTRCRPS